MQKLVETYDNNIENWWNDEGNPMAPICHIVKSAQIEIVITSEGEFISARELEKNTNTLIPVTEVSGARTSGISPHALCDMLPYVAGDYSSFLKKGKEYDISKEKHKQYLEALEKWVTSEHSHPKVSAIYNYISKNTLLQDCIESNLVKLEGNVLDKSKVSGQPYEKCVVRFRVINEDGIAEGTWEDRSLVDTFIEYYLSRPEQNKDVCYMSGETLPMATIHPKGILAAAYGAKLISANDTVGFTYRGRFETPEQAFGMGYESSQKLHSALTWVAKCYGTYIGTTDKRMLMIWNPAGKDVPNIYHYSLEEVDFEEQTEEEEVEEIRVENYQKKLWKSLSGFRETFADTDEVIIMGMEAATTGRLSITYYQELMASDFLQNIADWQNSCRWYFLKFDDKKKPYYDIESPNFYRIVECALGRERGNFIDLDDKLLKEHVQILTKCMLEKQIIPYYLVSNLFERASTPLAYSPFNRERVLSVACAVISKYMTDTKKKGKGSLLDMTLDKESNDRSYLFGRLLAVYEKIERNTYDKGEMREPNAIRLQNTFVNRPLYAMGLLDRQIAPYLQKHSAIRRAYYKKILAEIVDKIYLSKKETLNQRLEETYLLGYYMQRAELNKRKGENNYGEQ